MLARLATGIFTPYDDGLHCCLRLHPQVPTSGPALLQGCFCSQCTRTSCYIRRVSARLLYREQLQATRGTLALTDGSGPEVMLVKGGDPVTFEAISRRGAKVRCGGCASLCNTSFSSAPYVELRAHVLTCNHAQNSSLRLGSMVVNV